MLGLCVQPAAHVPSAAARVHIEALFTALPNGWAKLLRETMAAAAVFLCARYDVLHRPLLQGMFRWWPVNLNGPAPPGVAETDELGVPGRSPKGGAKCNHFPYPVVVQRRHLPTGERRRAADDMTEDTIEVSQVTPRRSPSVHAIIASLLILLDKAPSVVDVITKKLAECGVVSVAVDAAPEDDEPDVLTTTESRLKNTFVAHPRPIPPTPFKMDDPPPTSRLPGAAKTTGDTPTTAGAARRAAKQEAGSSSQT